MKKIIALTRNISADVYTMAAHLVAALALSIALFTLTSCNNSELWEDLPYQVTKFINAYFPNSELQSVSTAGGGYHIRIDNGPGLSFDSDEQWVSVDGYGMPLPQVLLFDQLPPAVYNYLQETTQLNSVFSISRDAGRYTISLLNSDIYYDTATDTLTGTDPTIE